MTLPVIYTAEDCPRCEHVKRILRDAGIEFQELSAEEWLTGSAFHPNWRDQRLVEARAMLAIHDDVLPVIDCQGNQKLKERLIELWKANPIPRCTNNTCRMPRKM